MHVVNVGAFINIEAFHAANPNHVYVGRPTPLGNPFRVPRKAGAKARAEAIESYRRWLWEQIQVENKEVMDALKSLRPEHILGCWCKPKSCHADVIMRCCEWMWERDPPPDDE